MKSHEHDSLPDIRQIYENSASYQSNILKGIKISFSGLLTEKEFENKNNFFYYQAKKMGALIIDNFTLESAELPQYLLVKNMKNKSLKIKIAT